MKRYIDVEEFKLPCTPGDCYECIFFSLNKCIMKEHINNAATENVIEVTDKSMESLIKGLEILGNIKNCADVVEVVKCKDCRWYEDPNKKIFENCVRSGRIIPMQPTDYCSYGEQRNDGKML